MKRTQIFSRFCLILLALALMVPLFAACSGNGGQQPADTKGTEDESSGSAPERGTDSNGYIKDTLGDDIDLGGTTLNILWYQERGKVSFPNSSTDYTQWSVDLVPTTYARRLALEERLHVYFNVTYRSAEWGKQDEFLTQARACNENEFDLICSYSQWPSVLAQEGLLWNLKGLRYPELDSPWWPESTQSWEQWDSLYFIASNSSISAFDSMEVIFANEDLIRDRQPNENLVDVALAGNWTVDKMIETIRLFEDDLDGSNKQTYGLVIADSTRTDSIYYGAGFNSTVNGNDGKATLAYTSQSQIDLISGLVDKLIPAFSSSAVMMNAKINSYAMQDSSAALFIGSLSQIKEKDSSGNSISSAYSPLPLPKLNEQQTNYRTIQDNGYEVWCIPISAKNPEISGIVIEAFGSSDYREIAPWYFEKYMKLRYSSDDKCMQMFELVRNSVISDLGRISQATITNSAEGAWRACWWSSDGFIASNNFSGVVASQQGEAALQLAGLLQKFRQWHDRNQNG